MITHKNSIHYKNLHWLWWSVFIFIADQVSKWIALHYLVIGKPITIFSWLNLRLNFNKGAAFSFLHHAGGWQRWFLVTLAIVICIARGRPRYAQQQAKVGDQDAKQDSRRHAGLMAEEGAHI